MGIGRQTDLNVMGFRVGGFGRFVDDKMCVANFFWAACGR